MPRRAAAAAIFAANTPPLTPPLFTRAMFSFDD
jgi:hypothetical protein